MINHRIEFNNMGFDIYGEYVRTNGITSITKNDLSKSIIKFDRDLLIITINGTKHIVQSNNEFTTFFNNMDDYFKAYTKELNND